MSDPFLLGLPPEDPGASDLGRQEPPVWVVVEAQLNFRGLHRGDHATVNPENPDTKRYLAAGWLIPIPASLQPTIVSDTYGNPTLKEDSVTVRLTEIRKVAVIGFTVEGDEAEVQADGQTKKTVKNTGTTDVYYPADFTGASTITVQGSKPGSAADTGTITIT